MLVYCLMFSLQFLDIFRLWPGSCKLFKKTFLLHVLFFTKMNELHFFNRFGLSGINVVPVFTFLGWLTITTLIVFTIAGSGIFLVEGFFVLLGTGIGLPIIGFALFSAFITFCFLLLGYGGF